MFIIYPSLQIFLDTEIAAINKTTADKNQGAKNNRRGPHDKSEKPNK